MVVDAALSVPSQDGRKRMEDKKIENEIRKSLAISACRSGSSSSALQLKMFFSKIQNSYLCPPL
jgi:hypothetical protein